MLKIFRDYWGYLTAVVVLALTFILRPDILERLLNSDGFIPHGHCYLWQPGLVWLHLASDLLTGLAYVAISATLAILVYRTRKEIPFHWMLLAFGTFIVACGSTHFMAVWTLWHPTYWLAGALKAITAFASVATAVALPALVPRSVLLVEEAKLSEERRLHLESANEKLKELDLIKTQFFANVSHELRTPLTLILGPTEKLLEETDLEAEQRRSLEVIARNARLLLKQVNDLLDVSKLEAKGMEVYPGDFDLAQLVRRTAANFDGLAQEKQVAFVVDTPDAVPVQLDEAKVERIVLNLLSNAFKFTPEGGTIRCAIATTHHANSPAEAGINPAVTITVEDSGPGIPQPLQEVIFERFRQGEGSANRRYGGTGLGLAIVKEFVELQGGSVSISDAAIGGACFQVALPLNAPGNNTSLPSATAPGQTYDLAQVLLEELWPHATAPVVQDATPAASKPLILVVEDNPEMQQFVASTLTDEYQIAVAQDGQAGWEQAQALQPDLILSDVMMPRLSGDQLVAQIRSHPELNDIPILMLTAKADDHLRIHLLQQGVQDYLMKPFSAGELKARVKNLVTIRRTRVLLQQELASQSHDLEALAQEVRRWKQELQIAYGKLQQQAEELTQANRLKDEFLGIISHELRTPLNSILGWAKMLRSRNLDATVVSRALESIERNATTQAILVEDLLDISRLLGGKLKLDMHPVELKPLIQASIEAVTAQAEDKKIQIQTHLSDAANLVSGNFSRLQQVIQNLLENAIKFTPERGQVEVVLEYKDDQAKIEISDTGQGINPDFLPYVFDYFRQEDSSTGRKYSGLGLGLAIAQRLVHLHQGQVQVENQGKETGVKITVFIPLLSSGKLNPVGAAVS